MVWGFPHGSVVKNSAGNAGDVGSIPGSGRSPGEGNVYPLQYSCLEDPMDRGARQAKVQGSQKSWTDSLDLWEALEVIHKMRRDLMMGDPIVSHQKTQSSRTCA